MPLEYLLIASLAISSMGGLGYAYQTYKGRTKPNKVTFGIWAFAPIVSGIAIVSSQGWSWSALPIFRLGFIPLVILLIAFFNKKSYWKLGKLDYICLALSILSILLWLITSNPLTAVILLVLADAIAAFPMVIKMYKFPETEIIYPFILSAIPQILALVMLEKWLMIEYIFPAYIIALHIVFVILYYSKRTINYFYKKV